MNVELNKEYQYKDLCAAFDLPRLSGSAQQKQIADIKRICDLKKNKKGRYIITRFYTQAELIEHQRFNKSKQYVETILMAALNKAPNNVISVNMGQLLEILNMVNKNFKKAKYRHNEVMDYVLAPDEEDVFDLPIFIEYVEKMSKQMVRSALKDMESRRLIDKVIFVPMFAFEVPLDEKSVITTRPANEETEIPIFVEAQRQVMYHFNFTNWEDCVTHLTHFQWKEAKEIMTEYLQRKIGISYFYYNYKIILNKTGLADELFNCPDSVLRSFNLYIQDKISASRAFDLTLIPPLRRSKYIDALIDSDTVFAIKNWYEAAQSHYLV